MDDASTNGQVDFPPGQDWEMLGVLSSRHYRREAVLHHLQARYRPAVLAIRPGIWWRGAPVVASLCLVIAFSLSRIHITHSTVAAARMRDGTAECLLTPHFLRLVRSDPRLDVNGTPALVIRYDDFVPGGGEWVLTTASDAHSTVVLTKSEPLLGWAL